jgi:hypothetical protein
VLSPGGGADMERRDCTVQLSTRRHLHGWQTDGGAKRRSDGKIHEAIELVFIRFYPLLAREARQDALFLFCFAASISTAIVFFVLNLRFC